SPGGLSDPNLQDGAAAAAAAGGAAGGAGEWDSAHPPGEAHQRVAGCHGCPPGVCVHPGAADEDAKQDV
ncbi:hypothetical protein chiPu_0021368, partial [Chiloscyllium punctatum]|nr:hypothetical protein [Chiloscyllium punctatum]